MQDPLASWAAIAGTIATFIVALLTYFSVRVARNSLKLMELREKRLQPSLQVFLIKSYMKRDKKRNVRTYAVNIGVTCTSDTDNSVKDLSMRIYFKRDGGIASNIVIPTMQKVDEKDINLMDVESNKILVIPLRIRAHEVVSGWAMFKVSDDFLAGSDIENYQVILTDAQNVESYFEIKIMNEVN